LVNVLSGIPDLSPMVLGTLANMKINWSTSVTDVVQIYNIFTDSGGFYTYFYPFFILDSLDIPVTVLFMKLLTKLTTCPYRNVNVFGRA